MIKKCVFSLGLFGGVVLILVAGCSKSDPQTSEKEDKTNEGAGVPVSQTQGTLVAKLHWLGKTQLRSETNATNFMAIWSMPESAKLEAQTLDKLSTAPWRLLNTPTPFSNAPVSLLRPLLDDLVQAESYLEVHTPTNQSAELVFAIRLKADRAAHWKSNVPAILRSVFTGTANVNSETPDSISLEASGYRFDLARAGDWTLLSLAAVRNPPSALLSDFRDRIQRGGAPFPARATNYWLETQVDPKRLNQSFNFGWSLPENSPALWLTAIGEEGRVRTRANLQFERPLPLELEPWNIPTNLVHDPLVGFMAVRSLRPLIQLWPGWDKARFGEAPDQAFFWSQSGPPMHFFAMHSESASSNFNLVADFLLNKVNPLMKSAPHLNGLKYGSFERVGDSMIRWRGIPMLAPNVQLADNNFVAGGLFPNRLTNRPAPLVLLQQLHSETNLILYDWELTSPNVFGLIQMTQLGRFVFGRSRLSMTNNAVLPWLTVVSTNLGEAGTSLRLSASNRLTFSRSSTVGFTGAELHLIADWLESRSFPVGLYSVNGGTNSEPEAP